MKEELCYEKCKNGNCIGVSLEDSNYCVGCIEVIKDLNNCR